MEAHRNAADLLELGYLKDEVLRVLQDSPLPLKVVVMTPIEEEIPINQTHDTNMVLETQNNKNTEIDEGNE